MLKPVATDIEALKILDERLRWLSAWTIHHANHIRGNADGLKVGGHQASCASMTAIMTCDQCLAGWEVFCREGCTQTYNSPDRHSGENTKGGYTDHIVVRDHFVLKVPDGMDESRVAPLLCAGITTYSPLRQYNVGPTTKMAVVGLGGLGHMLAGNEEDRQARGLEHLVGVVELVVAREL